MKHIALVIMLLPLVIQVRAENWNRFRGPEGRGHAGKINVPLKRITKTGFCPN